ncbi:MAG: DUF4159 domain-containing protein [Alphaproteobacteria bacterium]|nr:DUF4159 domain-containing protein [Alphaproteobacteria bacterium]
MTTRLSAFRTMVLPALLALSPLFAQAQGAEPESAPSQTAQAVQQANKIHLGYVRTSSSAVNSDTQRGLEALATELTKRTAIKPKGVVALDVERDDLSFHQFIYWPVTPDARPLSEAAQKRVQNYIDNGGVILFDLRDAGGVMRDQRALQRLLSDMNIKPLVTMAKDHTLTKTFYLLSGLPGSSAHGALWVEAAGAKGTESVSTVIVGDNNWADAWAGKTVLQNSREREMALRAGINMVVYAYTGNFKADPIHDVLERLKR